MLLADPRVRVNQPDHEGATPCFMSSHKGHFEVVKLLVADHRIDVNQPDSDSCTPLWMATQEGRLDVAQIILASGREIDTSLVSTFNNRNAVQQGRRQVSRGLGWADSEFQRKKTGGPLISNLIEEFEKDPEGMRWQLRRLPPIRPFFSPDSSLP